MTEIRKRAVLAHIGDGSLFAAGDVMFLLSAVDELVDALRAVAAWENFDGYYANGEDCAAHTAAFDRAHAAVAAYTKKQP